MTDRKCKAVLFDFDGTLSKTVKKHFASWKKAFSSYGVDIEENDYYPFEGQNLLIMIKNISNKYNLLAEAKDILNLKETIYLKKHKFSLYPGVEKIIDKLSSTKTKIAIVTAGRRSRINNSIPSYFLQKFDVIVCGDDTERGKPFPDPFLKGMQDLKVKPSETVVVENAPFGISSGKASGAYVIAICSTVKKEKLVEADEIFFSFNEIVDSPLIRSVI